MENSIVFDGAYPNAIIQSSIGEEIETPTGKMKRLEGKKSLSKNDLIIGYSTNNGINLLYKESEEKGGLENMEGNEEEVTELENENVGTEEVENTETEQTETENEVTETEGSNEETETEEAEEGTEETEEQEEEETEETLYTSKDILNKFGNICDSVEQLVELAKEGLEIRNEVISEALESGVHSMGNAFNKDIFTKTFSNMKTKDIKEMAQVWEQQAKDMFVKGKVSKQEFAKDKEEGIKVNLKQFKTGIY
jgi:hypothetical protein